MSEIRDLAVDLEKKAWRAIPEVAAVVKKGAQNIKEQYRSDAESTGTTKHFSKSISYDINKGGLEAEIGPDPSKTQGPLDNILYFGDSKRPGVLDFDGPPREEEPRFHRAIEDVVGDL